MILWRRLVHSSLLVTALHAFLSSAPAQAQIDPGALEAARDAVRQALDPSKAGALYAASINFTVHPDIATADFRLDGLEDSGAVDPRLTNYRLPLRYRFDPGDSKITPFLQGTVGYQDLLVGLPLLPGSGDVVSADWRSKGIDVGAGVEYAVNERWTLLPSINLGVAELRNKADYGDSPLGPIFQPILEGIVFDWETRAWIAGAGLAARYDRAYERFAFHANGSLSSTYIRSFDASSSDIRIADSATTFDLELSTVHPMGTVANRRWSLVTILGATNLLGQARGELGFDYFLEAGLAVQFDLGAGRLPLDKLRVGLKAIGGPDVSGWSIVLGRGI